MMKVTIDRSDVKGTIVLTLNDTDESPVDLKLLVRFLTEVARASGFSYVEDMAALTSIHVISGTESKGFWQKRLKESKE